MPNRRDEAERLAQVIEQAREDAATAGLPLLAYLLSTALFETRQAAEEVRPTPQREPL